MSDPGVPNLAEPAARPEVDRHVVAVLDCAIVWRDEVRGTAGVDLSERERALAAAVDALLASRHTLRDEPPAQQPLSRDEQWEAEKVVTSLPGLGYDWTTINDYNAAQAWAVEAYLAAAAQSRTEYDEATQELAAELADERTLHQETIRERDQLRAEVARVRAAVAEEIAAQLELLQIAQEDLMQRRSAEGYPEQARQCATRARAYKAAAGVAREHVFSPAVGVQEDTADTGGTPDVSSTPEGRERLRVAMAEELDALRAAEEPS